jgi:hypothetical protein
VIASGLWMRRPWASRAGMIITVFAIAIDLFIFLVSIDQTTLDVSALLSFVLNSVVLSLFLQSEVIRTVIQLVNALPSEQVLPSRVSTCPES